MCIQYYYTIIYVYFSTFCNTIAISVVYFEDAPYYTISNTRLNNDSIAYVMIKYGYENCKIYYGIPIWIKKKTPKIALLKQTAKCICWSCSHNSVKSVILVLSLQLKW